jgi:hypothetical protein
MSTFEFDYESPEDLEKAIRDRGWTDGLPINLSTPDRVARFIAASGVKPDDSLGHVPPQGGEATIRLIAVNAVMAGCEPEHFPVVVAAVKALLKEPFNLYMVQVTTNPVAPLAIVNGPVRHKARLRWGRDAFGPGPGGNGPIGRAIRLVLRNIGGAGENDTSTHGSAEKYTFCIAEDEDSNPWEPLHVWLGYQREDSVVTTLGIESRINAVPESGTTTAENLLSHIGHAMQTVGTGVYWSRGNPTVILTPGYAQLLASRGMSRADVQAELFERSKIPVNSLPFPNINTGDWKLDGDRVLVCSGPEEIFLVVAGSPEGHHFVYFVPLQLVKPSHAKVE